MTNGHDQLSASVRHKYAVLHASMWVSHSAKNTLENRPSNGIKLSFCLVFKRLKFVKKSNKEKLQMDENSVYKHINTFKHKHEWDTDSSRPSCLFDRGPFTSTLGLSHSLPPVRPNGTEESACLSSAYCISLSPHICPSRPSSLPLLYYLDCLTGLRALHHTTLLPIPQAWCTVKHVHQPKKNMHTIEDLSNYTHKHTTRSPKSMDCSGFLSNSKSDVSH